jgi:hypothetical protein
LLEIQRDIYRIPPGMERFRTYLSTMVDGDIDDLRLPLTMMNPMAKDHAAAHLDQLLALDAEGVAARAIADTEQNLKSLPGQYTVGLVLADDLIWTSEPPNADGVREAVSTAIYRLAYVLSHGPARTLRDRMAQEGYALESANCPGPLLDHEDLTYSRHVIAAYLDTADMRTTIQCLFGDSAGRTLGFPPLGLSSLAGLAVARSFGQPDHGHHRRRAVDLAIAADQEGVIPERQ